MIVNYDLEHQLCSSDFYGWLVEWADRGASEIVFNTSKFRAPSFPPEVSRRRFDTMIKPGPAFLGLPCREGSDGERVGLRHKNRQIIEFARGNNTFKRLRSVLPPREVHYTVTIRQATNDVRRNSDREAWVRFAAEIEAMVIEDYVVQPFDIHELMALYAGAKMNFGVWGGPMYICSLSEYPCLVLNCGAHRTFLEKCGAIFNKHMPWCRKDQFTFWDSDSYENIQNRFEQWHQGEITC